MPVHAAAHTHAGFTHPPTLLLLGLVLQIGATFAPSPVQALPWPLQLTGGALVLLGIGFNIAAVRGFGLLLIIIFPEIALWLPRYIYGS